MSTMGASSSSSSSLATFRPSTSKQLTNNNHNHNHNHSSHVKTSPYPTLPSPPSHLDPTTSACSDGSGQERIGISSGARGIAMRGSLVGGGTVTTCPNPNPRPIDTPPPSHETSSNLSFIFLNQSIALTRPPRSASSSSSSSLMTSAHALSSLTTNPHHHQQKQPPPSSHLLHLHHYQNRQHPPQLPCQMPLATTLHTHADSPSSRSFVASHSQPSPQHMVPINTPPFYPPPSLSPPLAGTSAPWVATAGTSCVI